MAKRRTRIERLELGRIKHGTHIGYAAGCGCDPCFYTMANQKKKYHESNKDLRNAHAPWTQEEERIVMQEGLPMIAIARQLGRSVNTVVNRRCIIRNR